jgi:mono/diheme cytochrome c family protein
MFHTRLFFGALVLGGVAYPVYQQQTPAASGRLSRPAAPAALALDRWQAKRLPPLPQGVTLDMIRLGDSVYHYAGGCVTCHGPNAMGLPDKGSGLSLGLHFVPVEPAAIDSLVTAGLPEAVTRTTIAMPPRGAGSNLSPEQIRQVAAYVWAIASTYDEPWPGGHATHGVEKKRNTGE